MDFNNKEIIYENPLPFKKDQTVAAGNAFV